MIKYVRNTMAALMMLLAVSCTAACSTTKAPPKVVFEDRLVPIHQPCKPKNLPPKKALPLKDFDLSLIEKDSKEDIWPVTVVILQSLKASIQREGELEAALEGCMADPPTSGVAATQ